MAVSCPRHGVPVAACMIAIARCPDTTSTAPLALATEVLAERWTLLVLRELGLGARHFNDIHRGVPRMSPTLLTRRLRTLERTELIERVTVGRRIEYRLTDTGQALMPTIESLAAWSKAWPPATPSDERADPDLILWDTHRRMNTAPLPDGRTVIRFVLVDQPEARRRRWLVCERYGSTCASTTPASTTTSTSRATAARSSGSGTATSPSHARSATAASSCTVRKPCARRSRRGCS